MKSHSHKPPKSEQDIVLDTSCCAASHLNNNNNNNNNNDDDDTTTTLELSFPCHYHHHDDDSIILFLSCLHNNYYTRHLHSNNNNNKLKHYLKLRLTNCTVPGLIHFLEKEQFLLPVTLKHFHLVGTTVGDGTTAAATTTILSSNDSLEEGTFLALAWRRFLKRNFHNNGSSENKCCSLQSLTLEGLAVPTSVILDIIHNVADSSIRCCSELILQNCRLVASSSYDPLPSTTTTTILLSSSSKEKKYKPVATSCQQLKFKHCKMVSSLSSSHGSSSSLWNDATTAMASPTTPSMTDKGNTYHHHHHPSSSVWECLAERPNQLQVLQVTNCNLSSKDCQEMGRYFLDASPRLSHLYLHDNPEMGHDHHHHPKSKNNNKLQNNPSLIQSSSPSCWTQLCDTVSSHKLVRLDLSHCGIRTGLDELLLENFIFLRALNLSENPLAPDQWDYLARAMTTTTTTTTSLQELILQSIPTWRSTILDHPQTIPNWIRQSTFSNNNNNNNNNMLQRLDLSGNPLTIPMLEALSQSSCSALHLLGCDIDNEGLVCLLLHENEDDSHHYDNNNMMQREECASPSSCGGWKELHLAHNQISRFLDPSSLEKRMHQLTCLNLEYNRLTAASIQELHELVLLLPRQQQQQQPLKLLLDGNQQQELEEWNVDAITNHHHHHDHHENIRMPTTMVHSPPVAISKSPTSVMDDDTLLWGPATIHDNHDDNNKIQQQPPSWNVPQQSQQQQQQQQQQHLSPLHGVGIQYNINNNSFPKSLIPLFLEKGQEVFGKDALYDFLTCHSHLVFSSVKDDDDDDDEDGHYLHATKYQPTTTIAKRLVHSFV